jgi:hypothetical protein
LSRVGVNLFLRHRNDIPVSLYVNEGAGEALEGGAIHVMPKKKK